jgi:hypothetical protein
VKAIDGDQALTGNQFHRLRLDQRFRGTADPAADAEGVRNDNSEMGADLLSGLHCRRRPRFHRHIGASADVARFLFYVFVVIFLVLLILGLTIFRV